MLPIASRIHPALDQQSMEAIVRGLITKAQKWQKSVPSCVPLSRWLFLLALRHSFPERGEASDCVAFLEA